MTTTKVRTVPYTGPEILEYLKKTEGAVDRVMEVLTENKLLEENPYIRDLAKFIKSEGQTGTVTGKHIDYMLGQIKQNPKLMQCLVDAANKKLAAQLAKSK